GQAAHLIVDVVAVAAGLGAQGDAAVGPLGSADGALAGVAGALLAPGLLAAARDFLADLGVLGALALVGQEVHDCDVNSLFIRGDAEHGVGKLDLADLFAVPIDYVKFCHCSFPSSAFTPLARMTMV